MPLNFLNNGYFAGKVGIGTNSPGAKLEIKDGDIWLNGATSSSNPEIRFLDDSPTIAGAKIRYGNSDGNLYVEHMWDTSTSGIFFRNRTTGTTLNTMALANGNVGIGTTSPNYPLDIQSTATGLTSNLKLNKSSTTGDYAEIAFQLWSGAGSGLNTFGGSGTSRPSVVLRAINENASSAAGAFVVGTFTGGATNSTLTEKFRISSDGNVGIGTTSPDALLEISGNAGADPGPITNPTTFRITDSGNAATGLGDTTNPWGKIEFYSEDASASGPSVQTQISSIYDNIYSYASSLTFSTRVQPSTTLLERMRISSAGAIKFNAYDSTNQTGTPTYILGTDASGNVVKVLGADIPGVPGGSGTLNTVTMWTPDGDTLGDSPITISGNDIISSGRGIIENTTNLTTGVVDSLLIKNLSSGTPITNGFGTAIAFYLENTVYSAVNEVGKISIIQTDTTAIDNKMVFSVKDNNILADRLTLTGQEAVFTGNVGIGNTSPGAKLVVGANVNTAATGIEVNAGASGGNVLSNGTAHNWFPYVDSNNYYSASEHIFRSEVNGSTRMTIKSDGRVGIGIILPTEKLEVVGNIKITAALLSSQENTDVDTGTEVVGQVLKAIYTAAFFDFVIKKGTNIRSGTVYACHDGTNVEFTETSTNDLGDTSDVTLSVDLGSTTMRLLATTTSDDWSIKSLIRAI